MADPLRATNVRTALRNQTADIVDAAPRVDDAASIALLLDAISDATLGVDRGGRIRIANRAASELFDYPVDGLTGGSIEQLLPESIRERHRPLMESFFERPVTRRMGAGLPLAARRRDGEVFFADISLAAVELASYGALALITVRDVSQQRRERLIAAQYLITQALAESETLESAAGAVLGAVGPASGANIAALWVVDGDTTVRFVDSWCASEREQAFHAESVDAVFPLGHGVLGDVVAEHQVQWCSDVLVDPRFERRDMARRLGLHAGVWIPFPEGDDRVLGVLELLFSVVRGPEPGMLRILDGFAAQLAQYLALRRNEDDRRRVLGQIVQGVEDERRRIASDLHDDTVQVLVASLISIDRLSKSIDPESTRAHELLTNVRGTLAAATDRTRHMIFDLRPQLLEAEGVMPAIAEVAALAGREAGFDIEITQTSDRFDPAVEALLYRVMKEAITNARKHSQANNLRCSLETAAGGVLGEVADDGVGFQLDNTLTRARERLSFGLSTILELVRLAGGRVDVESAPTGGTLVRIWLPLRLTSSGKTRTPATTGAAGHRPIPSTITWPGS
jgi:PAS domain S-box-containing protein